MPSQDLDELNMVQLHTLRGQAKSSVIGTLDQLKPILISPS